MRSHASPLAAPPSRTPPDLRRAERGKADLRLHLRRRGQRARPRGAVRLASEPRRLARVDETPLGAAASPRLRVRPRQPALRRVPLQIVGLRHAHRAVRRPLSDAEDAAPRARGAGAVRREARRGAVAAGCDEWADGGAAARLQRLLRRRRRHRRARLRQLRHPRRLRAARAARRRRQGQDRHFALRRLVARHQAEGRGGARRHRLHHLLRPARRRLLPGRRLSEGRAPTRRRRAARRASVMDMPVHPGDPLTPGVGATKNAKRLDIKDVDVLTKIPVLPISYGDALPLLRALGGPVAPPDWRGALPITYHLGAGPARVHIKLAFNWNIVPAYDVVARLAGSERGDEWVMRGNHSDAWVNGAQDPISGLVAELAEARAIGELAKTGWKPKRTIMYFAWDGEEEGLLGSTEWAEEHAAELRQHGVVYINTDSNGRGFYEPGGSHTLERLTTQAARDVADPERNVSGLERKRAHDLSLINSPEERKAYRERELIRLDALGSGSDYTTFLQHVGVAAMNVGFGGEAGGGSYHSIYDSFDHFTRFIDPNFDYGVALAKTDGRMVLRLADADVLPFEFTTFADTMSRYLERQHVRI